MASITGGTKGTVSGTQPSANSVSRNSATVSWRASGWAAPSDAGTKNTGDSKNGSKSVISYSSLTYSWSFSPGGGSASGSSTSKTYSGLTVGASNTLRATVSVSCEKTVTVTSWTTKTEKVPTGNKDEDGNPIYTEKEVTTTTDPLTTYVTVDIGSATGSVTVYTKPDSWSWSRIGVNEIIQDTLYASEWNSLIEQCRKYKQWQNQSSSVSINVPTVRSGDWITADLYNSMAAACGINSRVTGGETGTIISASLFTALANAVS